MEKIYEEIYNKNKKLIDIAIEKTKKLEHDVGRTVVDEGHEEESGKMLKQEMQKLGYEDKMIEQCYLAVVNHKRSSNPPTIEAKIVRDADKIAYIGRKRWKRCIEQDNKSLYEIIE